MNPDDLELIAAISARDEAAFERFYRRHLDSVVAYGTRHCRDPHQVAELCALVFVSVWQGAISFDPDRGTPAAWLQGIATHRMNDLRRSDRRRSALAERLRERQVLAPDDIARLTERIDAERTAPEVVAAVRRLSPAQREVIEMVAIDGLTSGEVAARTGTTPTAVRMRLARARRSVRSAVGVPRPADDESTEVRP